MVSILYGSGMRLMECLRLRVKDIDFEYNQIVIRNGKGSKDRVTMMPVSSNELFKRHLEKVKVIHEADLSVCTAPAASRAGYRGRVLIY